MRRQPREVKSSAQRLAGERIGDRSQSPWAGSRRSRWTCARAVSAVPRGAEAQARAALASLVTGSAQNVERVGIPDGLTGPAARGDVELIQRHVAALKGADRQLYLHLLEATIPLARARGSLTPEAEAALRCLTRT